MSTRPAPPFSPLRARVSPACNFPAGSHTCPEPCSLVGRVLCLRDRVAHFGNGWRACSGLAGRGPGLSLKPKRPKFKPWDLFCKACPSRHCPTPYGANSTKPACGPLGDPSYAGANLESWPSPQTIANGACVSVRTARSVIGQLISWFLAALLSIDEQGSQSSSLYRVNIAHLANQVIWATYPRHHLPPPRQQLPPLADMPPRQEMPPT